MALTLDSHKPIFPKHDYKYKERPKATCATYLSDRNPFNLPLASEHKMEEAPLPSSDGQLTTKAIDCKGKSRGLFFHHPQGNVNVICVKLSEDCKRPVPVICRERTKTRCTQTRYRESSAQTSPYLPEIGNDNENYKNYEVYRISKLLDSHAPPGEYEAKVVERARRRRRYENALKLLNEDNEKHRSILEALEWEDWIAREEYIHSCQMLRMEIVERMVNTREKNLRQMSDQSIACCTERIRAKRNSQLQKINTEYNRAMRRLKSKKQKINKNYRKGNIIQEHIDPASDLHAPQMRFGVNPNRRHFVGFRKHFDDRIDELDKQRDEVGLAGLTCPFSKLKNWAKPKERMKEVSQRFCSDVNLKNIYESLKDLRMHSEASKRNPKCLKKKTKFVQPKETINPDRITQERTREISAAVPLEEPVETENECESVADSIENLKQEKSKDVLFQTEEEISNIVGEFEGTTLGKLLQFLSEELERLKLQKKFQAIQLLAKKERWWREASEAGLRQKENKKREEHDKLFAKVYETRQDTSSLFLESVLEREFNFTTQALSRERITKLAAEIHEVNQDELDLESMVSEGKDGQDYNRMINDENQAFAEDRFAKLKASKLQEFQLRAIEEELYASVQKALADKFQTPDAICIVGEFLDELIDNVVTNDFEIFTPSTSESEFDPRREVNDVINKLLQLATHEPCEISSFDSPDINTKLTAEKEAKALIRKLIRKTIPQERWKTEGERIVEQTLSDIFYEAVNEIECMKASELVRSNDRLNQVISEIYQRLEDCWENDGHQFKPAEERSDSTFSAILRSIPSNINIFENSIDSASLGDSANGIIAQEEFQDQSLKTFDYVDHEKLDNYEPVEVCRCHERFNLLEKDSIRWKSSVSTAQISEEEDEIFRRLTTSSDGNENQASSSVLEEPHSRALYPDLPDFEEDDLDHMKLFSSYERASACFERLSTFQERPRCSCFKSKEDKRRSSY